MEGRIPMWLAIFFIGCLTLVSAIEDQKSDLGNGRFEYGEKKTDGSGTGYKTRPFNFGLGKRFVRYDMGLGKRNAEQDNTFSGSEERRFKEERAVREAVEDGERGQMLSLRMGRRLAPYGLGGSTQMGSYGFGLGRRSLGLGRRASDPYSDHSRYTFGVGKRFDNSGSGRGRFTFGVGRRSDSSGSRAYTFGIGRRRADPGPGAYTFGIGKRLLNSPNSPGPETSNVSKRYADSNAADLPKKYGDLLPPPYIHAYHDFLDDDVYGHGGHADFPGVPGPYTYSMTGEYRGKPYWEPRKGDLYAPDPHRLSLVNKYVDYPNVPGPYRFTPGRGYLNSPGVNFPYIISEGKIFPLSHPILVPGSLQYKIDNRLVYSHNYPPPYMMDVGKGVMDLGFDPYSYAVNEYNGFSDSYTGAPITYGVSLRSKREAMPLTDLPVSPNMHVSEENVIAGHSMEKRSKNSVLPVT